MVGTLCRRDDAGRGGIRHMDGGAAPAGIIVCREGTSEAAGYYGSVRTLSAPDLPLRAISPAGLAIAWGRIWGFVWVALVAVVQVARVRRDEAVREQAFGDDYRAWRSKTWF